MSDVIINDYLKTLGVEKFVESSVRVANAYQKAMEENKDTIRDLEERIRGFNYELTWYHTTRSVKYLARKGNIEIVGKSEAHKDDEFNKIIGRLISVSRLFKAIYKIEGENNG